MEFKDRTKEHLLEEIAEMRQRIAELEKSETELKQATQQWQTSFDFIHDLVSIHDKDFNIVWANKAFSNAFKKKSEELIGKKCYEVIHGTNDPWPHCPHKQTIETEEPITEEFFEPVLGIYLQVSTSPVFNEKGKINGTVHIAKDITERKNAEIEIRLHSEIVANIAEGVILVRANDGVIVYTNEKFEEMFDYGHNELIGQHISVVNAPADKSPEETTNEIMESLNKNGMWQGEIQNIKKNKISFWCHASVSIFDHSEHGKVFLSVHTDITDRKKAEVALQESENRYRDLFENANDLIQSVLPDGRFKYVNRAWQKTFGYDLEDIRSLSIFDIIHPDSRSHCMEVFKRVMAGDDIDKIEAVFVTKNGKNIIVEGSVNCKFEDVKPVATRGIFRDITERKKVEKLLEKAHGELEIRVKERTGELESAVKLLQEEITERKKIENELQETEKRLIAQTTELTESNAALKALLRQREEDKEEIENNILSNVKHLVQPYIEKLKKNKPVSDELTCLKILESNLEEIVSPFAFKLSSKYLAFSPRELQVADLIKDGKQDKEIIEILNISPDTIKIHRKNIRRKLGIYREKINLRTKLLSLDK